MPCARSVHQRHARRVDGSDPVPAGNPVAGDRQQHVAVRRGQDARPLGTALGLGARDADQRERRADPPRRPGDRPARALRVRIERGRAGRRGRRGERERIAGAHAERRGVRGPPPQAFEVGGQAGGGAGRRAVILRGRGDGGRRREDRGVFARRGRRQEPPGQQGASAGGQRDAQWGDRHPARSTSLAYFAGGATARDARRRGAPATGFARRGPGRTRRNHRPAW